MKIAAIQLNARFADVKTNLMKSEKSIEQAVSEGAELVLLPEFFTSAIGFSQQMLNVALDNRRVPDLLKQWAAKYKVIMGGSYLSFDGSNAFNAFDLVFPSGDLFEHKKDIPTQFENCYYTDGDENNVLVTPIGHIGVALCWEMIRYDTLKRLIGKADVILSGSCWWDLPIDAPPERESLRRYNQSLARDTPVTFAKLAGIPVAHASHCGKVTALHFPDADKMQTRQLVGAAQIINGDGQVLARKDFSEGEGFVMADITWKTAGQKKKVVDSRYWIPDLPDSYIHAWETSNQIGKQYYESVALPYYKSHLK